MVASLVAVVAYVAFMLLIARACGLSESTEPREPDSSEESGRKYVAKEVCFLVKLRNERKPDLMEGYYSPVNVAERLSMKARALSFLSLVPQSFEKPSVSSFNASFRVKP